MERTLRPKVWKEAKSSKNNNNRCVQGRVESPILLLNNNVNTIMQQRKDNLKITDHKRLHSNKKGLKDSLIFGLDFLLSIGGSIGLIHQVITLAEAAVKNNIVR